MYRSRLPRIALELEVVADAATHAGAELVEMRAKQRVPVGAPEVHLRDEIHVEHIGPSHYAVVAGNTKAFYGHIVENGSAHSAPHPFLVPALEESRAQVVGMVAAALRKL